MVYKEKVNGKVSYQAHIYSIWDIFSRIHLMYVESCQGKEKQTTIEIEL